MNIFNITSKYIKAIIYILIILFLLIIIINLGLRKIIISESVQDKLIAKITEKTKLDIKFEKIDIFLIPTPHVRVYKGKFSIDGSYKTTFDFKSADIFPKIIPLLKREVKIKNIEVNSPKILLTLPEKTHKTPDIEPKKPSFLYNFEKYYKDLIAVALEIPLRKLQINDGKLLIFKNDKKFLHLHEVNAGYQFSNNLINVKFSIQSDFAQSTMFIARVSSIDKKANAELKFDSLNPQFLSDLILNNSNYKIDNSEVDLDLKLKIQGPKKINVDIESPKFSLNLINKDEPFSIKGTNLNGSFHINDDKQLFSIKEVDFSKPEMTLNGDLLIDKNIEKSSLKIVGNDVDIMSTSESALSALSQYKIMDKIFQVLKAGEVESIEFYSQAKKINELFKNENFIIEGEIKNGDIYVDDFDLSFTNIKGNASVKNGVLYGNNIFGQVGNSLLKNGSISLGMGKENEVLKVKTDVDADLSELPKHLMGFIKNDKFLKFISSINILNGNASGKLILGDKKSTVKSWVKLNNFKLSVNHPKIPFTVNLSGTDFIHKESHINFKNVKGNISKTTFTDLAGKYDWGNESILEISSFDSNISVEELNPWASSFDKFSDYLDNFKKAKGNITIADLNLRVPISSPKKWDLKFKSKGKIYDKDKLDFSLIFIKSAGKFKIDNLKIKDDKSDALLNLEFNNNLYVIDFSGILSKQTTDKFIRANKLKWGWIEGDIRINYLENQISKSTANGNLKGGKIIYPSRQNNPVRIKGFSLNAQGNTINIEKLDFSVNDRVIGISGSIYSGADKLKVDIDASTDEITWTELSKYFENAENKERLNKKKESNKFPIEGIVKFNISKFNYDNLYLTPFQGDLNFNGESIIMEVKKASVCNINTTGELKLNDKNLALDLDALCDSKKIEDTLICFFKIKERINGEYNLRANINGQGNKDKIKENLNGEFELIIKDGRVSNKSPILLSILKVTNITEIYRGKIPDFTSEGLDFSSIEIKGFVKDGVIKFTDASLDSPYVGILFKGKLNLVDETYNLKFNVAVLKTVQDVIKKVPIVKRIKTEKLLSIPVRVKGKFNKPKTIESFKE